MERRRRDPAVQDRRGVLNSFGITSVVEGATEARDIRTLQKIAVPETPRSAQA